VKTSIRAVLLLSVLLFLTVGIASADSLITYQITGAVTASFELPVNPTVIAFTPGINFITMPINLMINGAPSSDTVDFFSAAASGGLALVSGGGTGSDLNVFGPVFYSGPESSPTMLGVAAGGVPLIGDGTGAGTTVGTLTTPGTPGPVGAVSTPEPSATILLGVGLLAVDLAALGFKQKSAITAN